MKKYIQSLILLAVILFAAGFVDGVPVGILGGGGSAYEDLDTDYTENDPTTTHIARTDTRVTVTGITRNEDANVYKSFGAAYFSGDFTHDFDIEVDDADVTNGFGHWWAWALTNLVDDMNALNVGDDVFLGLMIYGGGVADTKFDIQIVENDGADTNWSDAIELDEDTPYYVRMIRDDDAGGNGTLYVDVYSTANLRNVGTAGDGDEGNVSLVLNVQSDFQYLFVTNSWDSDSEEAVSGYAEYYCLTPPCS